MWLLNTSTFMLNEPAQNDIPPYAILSHTWSSNEVLFEDMRQNLAVAQRKDGWSKVETACKQAKLEKYEWIWIDSCCIDKKSVLSGSTSTTNCRFILIQDSQQSSAKRSILCFSGIGMPIFAIPSFRISVVMRTTQEVISWMVCRNVAGSKEGGRCKNCWRRRTYNSMIQNGSSWA
jgi:hypothetical protein